MHSKWVFKHFRVRSNKRFCVLAALWGIGLLFGVWMCCHSPYVTTAVLCAVIGTKPSILSLLLVCILPVALSAIATRSMLFPVAYLLVFLSAVSHGFCGSAVFIALGDAAWLLRPLLLFSGGCTSVLVWWLLFQSDTVRHIRKRICLALGLSCLVYIIDLLLVSPLIGDLIKVL